MDAKERIYGLIKDSEPVKTCTIPLLVYLLKKEGFSKKEILKGMYSLFREGELYIIPRSVCLIVPDKARKRKF